MMMLAALALSCLCPATYHCPATGQETIRTLASPAAAESRVPRLHSIAALTGADRVLELEDRLSSAFGTDAERLANYEELTTALSSDAIETRAEGVVQSLELLLGTEFPGAPVELQPNPGGSALLVLATEAQHERIASTLERLATTTALVDISAVIVRLPEANSRMLLGERTSATLTPAELTKLRADLDLMDAEQVSSPSLRVALGTAASMAIGKTFSFVADYELRVFPDDGLEIVDPIIGSAFDGVTLRLVSVPLEDAVRLAVEFESSSVFQPIARMNVRPREGVPPVELSLPEIRKLATSAVFDIAESTAVVFTARDEHARTFPAQEPPLAVLVLLETQLVAPSVGPESGASEHR